MEIFDLDSIPPKKIDENVPRRFITRWNSRFTEITVFEQLNDENARELFKFNPMDLKPEFLFSEYIATRLQNEFRVAGKIGIEMHQRNSSRKFVDY